MPGVFDGFLVAGEGVRGVEVRVILVVVMVMWMWIGRML